MYGKSDVVALDGIFGKPCVAGLIAEAWNQQNVVAVLAYDVYNLLHILCHHLVPVARTIIDVNGLIGELKQDGTVVLQLLVLGHMRPHLFQIFVIGIAKGYRLRADTWRAHHYVEPFRDGIFGHRYKDEVEIGLEALEVERRDVVLACGLLAGGVAPVGVHVLSHEGHLPPGLQDVVNDALVVTEASVHVVVGPLRPLLVEPGTEGLGPAVHIDTLSLGIHQERSFHMEGRGLRLGASCSYASSQEQAQ